MAKGAKAEAKPDAPKNKGGRPIGSSPLYSQAVADLICRRVASGQSLRAVCRMGGPGIPKDADTILKWRDQDIGGFAGQYMRACEERGESLAEEGLEIVDAAHGQPSEVVAAARLRWDARRWYASKLTPKRLGDKIEHEHSGGVTVTLDSKQAGVL